MSAGPLSFSEDLQLLALSVFWKLVILLGWHLSSCTLFSNVASSKIHLFWPLLPSPLSLASYKDWARADNAGYLPTSRLLSESVLNSLFELLPQWPAALCTGFLQPVFSLQASMKSEQVINVDGWKTEKGKKKTEERRLKADQVGSDMIGEYRACSPCYPFQGIYRLL